MKGNLLSSVLVTALLVFSAHADSAGTYNGGVQVDTAIVLDTLYVRVSDDGGTGQWRQVTADPGSADGRDVLSSGEITAPGGTTVKWFNGTPKKKNADGTWTRLPRTKGSRKTGELEGSSMDFGWGGGPGNNITSLPKPGPVIL